VARPARNDDNGDDRIATPGDNPFGSEWTFRRLAKEGAFRTWRGFRNRLEAWWSEVAAYQASKRAPRGKQKRVTDTELGIVRYPKGQHRPVALTPQRRRLVEEKKRAVKLTKMLIKVDAMLEMLDEDEKK
jgi:hypothetical protein